MFFLLIFPQHALADETGFRFPTTCVTNGSSCENMRYQDTNYNSWTNTYYEYVHVTFTDFGVPENSDIDDIQIKMRIRADTSGWSWLPYFTDNYGEKFYKASDWCRVSPYSCQYDTTTNFNSITSVTFTFPNTNSDKQVTGAMLNSPGFFIKLWQSAGTKNTDIDVLLFNVRYHIAQASPTPTPIPGVSSYLVTKGFLVSSSERIWGYVLWYKNIYVPMLRPGTKVLLSRNPDGTGNADVGDRIDAFNAFFYDPIKSFTFTAYSALWDCGKPLIQMPPQDITNVFYINNPNQAYNGASIKFSNWCFTNKTIGQLYLVYIEPSPTPTPTPSPTPTPTPESSKTPLIIVPGIVASSNWKILTDRGDSGWDWMIAAKSSWRQFIDSLEKAGYQKDKDYFIAFYDWRKTNDWTDPDPGAALPAKKYLTGVIDKAKTVNPGVSKVNIVAHSMGGLVTRSYIESPNYRGDINKAFLIGSPNAGSTFAYYTWEGGEVPPNWDPIQKAALNMMINFLSINFLQDRYSMIHDHIKSIKDLLPVGYNYLSKNNNFIDWTNMFEVNNFLKNTSSSQNTASIFANKGVSLINITGIGQTTWEKLRAEDYIHQYLWKDGKPLGEAGAADGDNTVLASSSNLPGAEQITIASKHANLPNAATTQIFSKLGISYIPSYLASAPDEVMVAWVASPVDLSVKDSSGNQVGELLTDPQSDKKWVFVENPQGDYKLNLTGTGTGEYHVGVDYYTDTKSESSQMQGSAVAGAQLDYDLHLDPQNPQPLDLQPEDKIAPVTSVQLSGTPGKNGWYFSDVIFSLSAIDNDGGTGIDKTEYSFNNATWQKYTTPLVISSEGITTIYYRSSDLVGNLEQTKQAEIKIDKTPPEAKISVNADKDDLEVQGIDQNQTTVQKMDNTNTKKKDDAIYIITDEAGNTLRLDVRERDKEKQDGFRIYSLQYNDNPKQILENNHFNVTYQGKKSKINVKEQNFEQKGEIKIRIRYDVKKDKSTIIVKEPKEEKIKEVKNGLVILQLNTNHGNLEATY